jgi:predicted amidophosphoribosyltransferase
VLVVDDILTTGATCSEIAAVVKRAGAVAVNVLVVARAQGKL